MISSGHLKVVASLAILAFLSSAPAAQANPKVDCLGEIFGLGVAARNNAILVPQGPLDPAELARQESIRKDLAIRVWVTYWTYDVGRIADSQFALGAFNTYLDNLVATGQLDLAAPGQPDFVALTDAAACINDPLPQLTPGLNTFQSGGAEREYFLQLPADYGVGDPKPLIIGLHGYTGRLENWVGDTRIYDLIDEVGDGAIMVFPNGLQDQNGIRSWNSETDVAFIEDLLLELQVLGLEYDMNRLFLAGHSNGAGFAHELGCQLGDVVRGVAAAAGALTTTDCVGSVAMLMLQGNNDPLVDIAIAQGTLNYWVLYNGWEPGVAQEVGTPVCDDYSSAGLANSPYPVLWCEHTQGHDWPDFGSAKAWAFFQGLSEAAPTLDAPFGGGAERATPPQDTTLTFQLDVPANINRPLNGAASFFPASFVDNPQCAAPTVFLNNLFSVDGLVIPGEVTQPITIPVTYFTFGSQPIEGEWALQITIYVEGGSRPLPTEGVDHKVVIPVTVVDRNQPLIISDVLTLEPAVDLCGF